MEMPLNDLDIKKFIPNVIVYSDLKNVTPEQLLRSLPVVILYQTTLNTGHWTLVHKTPEGVEFFDSYSSFPDDEFKFMSKQQPHYLVNLLEKLSNIVQINFNSDQLQELSPRVNDCGRWVILRYLLGNYPIDAFVGGVREMSRRLKISPDQLVTLII